MKSLIFALFLAASLAHAAEQSKVFIVGHNLTATSDVIDGQHCSFGLQVFACRIAEKTALGMSPWMLNSYSMFAFALRQLISEDEHHNRWATQVSYFKTYRNRTDNRESYEMHALWLQGIRTWQMKDDYKLHANVDVNYYFNDKMPFSLRRPSTVNSPMQINASVLFQVDLTNGFFMLGELGALDIFRPPFHTHSGVSIGSGNATWSWHIGYSLTATLAALGSPTKRADYQQSLLNSYGATYDDTYDGDAMKYDYAIHPEFAAQFTF